MAGTGPSNRLGDSVGGPDEGFYRLPGDALAERPAFTPLLLDAVSRQRLGQAGDKQPVALQVHAVEFTARVLESRCDIQTHERLAGTRPARHEADRFA